MRRRQASTPDSGSFVLAKREMYGGRKGRRAGRRLVAAGWRRESRGWYLGDGSHGLAMVER
jgi:hypothetical protein